MATGLLSFKILTGVSVNITVFWHATPCGLA